MGYNLNFNKYYIDLDTSLKKEKRLYLDDLIYKQQLSDLQEKYQTILEQATESKAVKNLLFKRSPDLRLVYQLNECDKTIIGLYKVLSGKKYKLITFFGESILDINVFNKCSFINKVSYFDLYDRFINLVKLKKYKFRVMTNDHKTFIKEVDISLADIVNSSLEYNRSNVYKFINNKSKTLQESDLKNILEIKVGLLENEFYTFLCQHIKINIEEEDVIIYMKELNYITQVRFK